MRSCVWSYHDLFVNFDFVERSCLVLILEWRWFDSILVPYLYFKYLSQTFLSHISLFLLKKFSQDIIVSFTQSKSMILWFALRNLVFDGVNAILNKISFDISNPRVLQSKGQKFIMLNLRGSFIDFFDSLFENQRQNFLFHIIFSVSISNAPVFNNFLYNRKRIFRNIFDNMFNKSTRTILYCYFCWAK